MRKLTVPVFTSGTGKRRETQLLTAASMRSWRVVVVVVVVREVVCWNRVILLKCNVLCMLYIVVDIGRLEIGV